MVEGGGGVDDYASRRRRTGENCGGAEIGVRSAVAEGGTAGLARNSRETPRPRRAGRRAERAPGVREGAREAPDGRDDRARPSGAAGPSPGGRGRRRGASSRWRPYWRRGPPGALRAGSPRAAASSPRRRPRPSWRAPRPLRRSSRGRAARKGARRATRTRTGRRRRPARLETPVERALGRRRVAQNPSSPSTRWSPSWGVGKACRRRSRRRSLSGLPRNLRI